MIYIAIRLKGAVGLTHPQKKSLFFVNLKRVNHACVFLEKDLKTFESLKNFISYGPICKDSFRALLLKRGFLKEEKCFLHKSINLNEYLSLIDTAEEELALFRVLKQKFFPSFRLHPPKGGYSKLQKDKKTCLGKREGMDKFLSKFLVY